MILRLLLSIVSFALAVAMLSVDKTGSAICLFAASVCWGISFGIRLGERY